MWSLLPSLELMSVFEANSAIVITDPAGFAAAVTKGLKGFRSGVDGPCSYQLRRVIEHDLGWLDLGYNKETEDISKFDLLALEKTIGNMAAENIYFLKHASFVSQAEWRFVWLVDHVVDKNILIDVPDARKFCVRWESQGDAIAFGGGASKNLKSKS